MTTTKRKTRVEFLFDQICDRNGFDYSLLTLEELFTVRAHAQKMSVDGSIDWSTRRACLVALIEIEDVLFLRLQS